MGNINKIMHIKTCTFVLFVCLFLHYHYTVCIQYICIKKVSDHKNIKFEVFVEISALGAPDA